MTKSGYYPDRGACVKRGIEKLDEAPPIVIEGEVDGVPVPDILVDTGTMKTMVHRSLVSVEKLMGEGFHVPIQCAH